MLYVIDVCVKKTPCLWELGEERDRKVDGGVGKAKSKAAVLHYPL